MGTVIQYILYLAVLVILAIPLGVYIKKVMNGEKTFLSKILTPCENAVYKVMRINKDEQMNWKKYAASVLVFSGIGLVFLFLLQLLQGVLPGNPQGLPGVKWDTRIYKSQDRWLRQLLGRYDENCASYPSSA